MSVVVDASLVVAALTDAGTLGEWAVDQLRKGDAAAPHLMPVEVANVLRRAEADRRLSPDVAALAHADLLALPVLLFPYSMSADRVWKLRNSITAYDAWYVALAETLDTTLTTLDMRLASASGPACDFTVPPQDLVP